MRFTKLTRANMRALPAGQEITEYGIRYTKLENGDGRFTIAVMVNRKRIHRVIGKESEGITREKCEEALEKLKTEAREERNILPKGRKVALLFEVAAEDYKKRLPEVDDTRNKKQRLDHHLTPFFKGRPISSITDWDIQRYKAHRAKQKVLNRDRIVSDATINRELATLSHLLRRAVRWGWMDKVPCHIEKLEESNKRDTILTQEEITQLLQAAYEHSNKQLFPFVYIGLNTSMRYSEILSIRAEHVQDDHIFIPKAKAGARHQPITRELADYLRSIASDGWLFPCQGRKKSKTGHTVDIRKDFREAVTTAGLNAAEIVRHTMRHTVISHLVMNGVDLPTVQQISGHKTFKVLVDNYAHRTPDHVQKALGTVTQDLHRPFLLKPEKLAPGGT